MPSDSHHAPDLAAVEAAAVACGLIGPGGPAALAGALAEILARHRRYHRLDVTLVLDGYLTRRLGSPIASVFGRDPIYAAWLKAGILRTLAATPPPGSPTRSAALAVQVGRGGHKAFTLRMDGHNLQAVEPPQRAGSDMLEAPRFLAEHAAPEGLFNEIAAILRRMAPELEDGAVVELDDDISGHAVMERERLLAKAGDPRPFLGERAVVQRVRRSVLLRSKQRSGIPPLIAVSAAP